MSDADALELARRALGGDAAALVRLIDARSRFVKVEVKELPEFNYTWRLPNEGPRSGLHSRAFYYARASWLPQPAQVVALTLVTALTPDEVPLEHETRVEFYSRTTNFEQRIPTRFLIREPVREGPFVPGFVFGRPRFDFLESGEVRVIFDSPTERDHRTDVYLHARIPLGWRVR
jgi:hypothetical protein